MWNLACVLHATHSSTQHCPTAAFVTGRLAFARSVSNYNSGSVCSFSSFFFFLFFSSFRITRWHQRTANSFRWFECSTPTAMMRSTEQSGVLITAYRGCSSTRLHSFRTQCTRKPREPDLFNYLSARPEGSFDPVAPFSTTPINLSRACALRIVLYHCEVAVVRAQRGSMDLKYKLDNKWFDECLKRERHRMLYYINVITKLWDI